MEFFLIQSEELLSWMFRIIFHGLRTIGVAPVSLQTETTTRSLHSTSVNVFLHSKAGLFYNILLSILTVIIGTFQMKSVFSLVYPNKTSVNLTLDIVQYSLEIFTACFAMIYWAFRQKQAAWIMNRLLDIHRLLYAPNQQLSNRRMLIFLGVHMIFNASLWMTFLASAQIFYKSYFNTIAICLPILVSYWFIVEYSTVLGFVARNLEILNANLLTSEAFPNDLSHMFIRNRDLPVLILPTNKQSPDIKLLHNLRLTLDEVCQDVADFFSLPILPIILLYFCMIVYHVYYIIVPILTPNTDLSLNSNIFISAWLIICIYPLILLSYYVTKTTKQAQRTGHLVHKLLATERKREIITELEQFSLRLKHENLSFTAYGFFTLDFKLIQSICGATATYLVIIIQFGQSTTT